MAWEATGQEFAMTERADWTKKHEEENKRHEEAEEKFRALLKRSDDGTFLIRTRDPQEARIEPQEFYQLLASLDEMNRLIKQKRVNREKVRL